MKYTILFSFLLAFANLKSTNKHKFNFKSLIMNTKGYYYDSDYGYDYGSDYYDSDYGYDYGSDYYYSDYGYDEDIDKDSRECEKVEKEDNQKCQAVKLNDNRNYQCCIISEFKAKKNKTNCELFLKPSKNLANIVKSKQFSPMLKEFVGIDIYGPMNDYYDYDYDYDYDDYKEYKLNKTKEKIEVECKDSSFSFEVGYDKYTDEDKDILGSTDSCLYYAYDSWTKKFQVSHDCKNGKVLDSSKKAGIECGILEISFQSPGASGVLNTCFLFSHDFYSKNTLPKGAEEALKYYLYDEGDLNIEKFSISLSDGNGNNKVTIKFESNCQFLSKSLLLIFLFLFLF